jgi:hypothetical protein
VHTVVAANVADSVGSAKLLNSRSDSLQNLHLGSDELFHVGIRWWWWYLLTTLVPVVVRSLTSVHHLIG